MFTSIRGVWGALGVMLALVALYLVLNNGNSAGTLITSTSDGLSRTFATLQGRGPAVLTK